MSKEDVIRVEGVIVECLPGTQFKVKINDGVDIICHLSGKMRINSIKLIDGDNVVVEMTSYDKTKGRIIFRK